MTRPLVLSTALALASCAQLVAFEQRAAPIIAQACAQFHAAEANPLVHAAIVGGSIVSPRAGLIVAEIRSYGARYCAEGPPPTDTTTPPQQASWLAGVTASLLSAAGAR